MNESDSNGNFIRNWQSTLDTALSAGNDIDEEMRFDLILGALPDSWDTLVTMHGNDDTSNMKDLLVKIRREELQRNKSKLQLDESTAMADTIRSLRGNQQEQRF